MKETIITFKADKDLSNALERMPNKSEFIRAALLAALDESCPFCGGSGTLTPNQRKHWLNFLRHHQVEHCRKCNGLKIHCDSTPAIPDEEEEKC